ncbi:hypothetical protein BDA99DRAFT_576378 [Phascolomyces articulosus]|uniref:Uncharacterized protein n=1 Tax=Phascolomyces articulosus TaxID=60185 RepID=A0AAD5P875_9FUNG|nr:hypothetical protein BDA99DRAFT_576378 [Phascolomyces articulosus]
MNEMKYLKIDQKYQNQPIKHLPKKLTRRCKPLTCPELEEINVGFPSYGTFCGRRDLALLNDNGVYDAINDGQLLDRGLDDWDSLIKLTFCNLTPFSLSNGPAALYSQILPGHVEFGHGAAGAVEQENQATRLIEAIIQKTNLYQFHITTPVHRFLETILYRFVIVSEQQLYGDNSATMTSRSNIKNELRFLEFFQCNKSTSTVLQHISNIRSLEHFALDSLLPEKDLDCFPALSADEINAFTHTSFVGSNCDLPFLSSLEWETLYYRMNPFRIY